MIEDKLGNNDMKNYLFFLVQKNYLNDPSNSHQLLCVPLRHLNADKLIKIADT